QRAADYVAAGWGLSVESQGVGVAIGRLRPGVSIEAARAFMAAWQAPSSLGFKKSADPDFDRTLVVSARPRVSLPFDLMGRIDPSRLAFGLMIIGGLVLLIGASNLAGLMTARSLVRRSEIALRLTLGTSRWRTARQLIA